MIAKRQASTALLWHRTVSTLWGLTEPLYNTEDARYLLGLPSQFALFSPYWPGP